MHRKSKTEREREKKNRDRAFDFAPPTRQRKKRATFFFLILVLFIYSFFFPNLFALRDMSSYFVAVFILQYLFYVYYYYLGRRCVVFNFTAIVFEQFYLRGLLYYFPIFPASFLLLPLPLLFSHWSNFWKIFFH